MRSNRQYDRVIDRRGLTGLSHRPVKAINVHDAKTRFSKLLLEVEERGSRFVICRHGQPVADLVPHQAVNRLQPDKKLGTLRIKYDPVEELAPGDWPAEAR